MNTDFIDNSAGVDTSDHEVNIKILLAGAIAADELRPQERGTLLHAQTDEVAAHVLRHNDGQNMALAVARYQAPGCSTCTPGTCASSCGRTGCRWRPTGCRTRRRSRRGGRRAPA